MTQQLRLLIVHPCPDVLVMLGSMLRATGHGVVEADTDRLALLLLRERPDLTVLGVDPADPDALELLAYIRRHYPDTPVILLFATPNPIRHEEALSTGAAAVLDFAPSPGDLRETINRAVEEATVRQVARIMRKVVGPSDDEPREQPIKVVTTAPVTECGGIEPNPVGGPVRPLKEALEGPERTIILRALEACGWNRLETAKALDINRTTLYKKMRKFGLEEA